MDYTAGKICITRAGMSSLFYIRIFFDKQLVHCNIFKFVVNFINVFPLIV